ncbi:unnamed protein product, partial [Musa acuminata subsp. malaccensis]
PQWRRRFFPPTLGLGVGPLATGGSHRQIPTPIIMAAMRSERDGGSNRLFLLGTGFVGRYLYDRLTRQG